MSQEGHAARRRRSSFRALPVLLQKSDLFPISQLPCSLLPAPSHRRLRLTNSTVLLLPLPLAPLASALETPPHPAFLHFWRLRLHFPLFPDSKHTQPTSHLHSIEAFPPAPALIGCFLPTSSSDLAFLQSPLVTPPPAYLPGCADVGATAGTDQSMGRARKGSIKSCHFLPSGL